jgi:acetyl esterase/lipase
MKDAPWRRRFRAPTMSLPQWARDQPERTVYVSNAGGKFEWYFWDRSDGTHRQLTDRPTGTMSAALDPPGEELWFFDDAAGNELGRWIRRPLDGSEDRVVPLPPAYSTGLAVGRESAIVSSGVEGRFSVSVIRPDVIDTVYKSEQSVSVGGLSRDEALIVIAHAEHGDSRNPALRVLSLDGAAIADLWDGPGRGLQAAGWSRVEGDQRLIVSHERHGIARPAIWAPSDGEVAEIEIDLPGEVAASWYPDGDALLLVHFWRGRSELFRLDLAAGSRDAIDTPTGMVTEARIHPSGELWYAITSSAQPPVVHCGPETLHPPGEQAPPGVAYRDLEVGAVHAFLAEPSGPPPHASIFVVHGGPAAADLEAFTPGIQAWVDHGFAVVLVNYRGSAGYGKAWRDAIVGKPGLLELEDIAAVRDQAIAAGSADPDRIVLSGDSWGGYLTLLGIGRQPPLWSLGVAGVPLADLEAHYEQQSTPLQAYWRALFGGTPDQIAGTLKEISPIEFAADVKVPVFVLVGDNDPRCPLGQVMNYVDRLRQFGKDVELYRYDAGHGSLVVDERIRQIELRLDFVARHLGTPKPA